MRTASMNPAMIPMLISLFISVSPPLLHMYFLHYFRRRKFNKYSHIVKGKMLKKIS
jgi:hypothetical protein